MRVTRRSMAMVICALLGAFAPAIAREDLAKGFAQPPNSAKPRVYGSESALFYKHYLLVSGYGSGTAVYRIGANPADLTWLQTLPTCCYNSKYFVEGDRLFTNSEGVDEFRLVPRLSATRSGSQVSIDWEGAGQLQAAPAVEGPWDTIPGAVNPHRSSNAPAQFFRVKVQ